MVITIKKNILFTCAILIVLRFTTIIGMDLEELSLDDQLFCAIEELGSALHPNISKKYDNAIEFLYEIVQRRQIPDRLEFASMYQADDPVRAEKAFKEILHFNNLIQRRNKRNEEVN